jgi:hypothetical protein
LDAETGRLVAKDAKLPKDCKMSVGVYDWYGMGMQQHKPDSELQKWQRMMQQQSATSMEDYYRQMGMQQQYRQDPFYQRLAEQMRQQDEKLRERLDGELGRHMRLQQEQAEKARKACDQVYAQMPWVHISEFGNVKPGDAEEVAEILKDVERQTMEDLRRIYNRFDPEKHVIKPEKKVRRRWWSWPLYPLRLVWRLMVKVDDWLFYRGRDQVRVMRLRFRGLGLKGYEHVLVCD